MKKGIIAACILAAALIMPVSAHAASEAVIPDGIYAQGIDLSGMTADQATEAIDSWFQEFADRDYALRCVDGTQISYKLSKWGFTWDSQAAVEQIMSYSSGSFLIRQYKARMNLRYGGLYLEVPFSINTDLLKGYLEDIGTEHDMPAQNAVLTRVSGSFVITHEEQIGLVTDVDATVSEIMNTLATTIYEDPSTSWVTPIVSMEDDPDITADMFSTITDELGSFSTDYAKSTKNRKTNIAVATENLNGTILMPGQKLSISKAIKERTTENGYMLAAQYSNGESEQDIGGGVCQVSTTIYNTILRAELQIDERHNHSMVVHYVPYGDDAAIAQRGKDLKFTNDTDYPIYIEGIADGDTLTFRIYGKDTRPANRTVKFEAKTLSCQYPAEDDFNIKYDSSLPKGKEQITGTIRPDVTATLTKVVYIDGVETERTLLHTDTYNSSRQTKIIGTGEAAS